MVIGCFFTEAAQASLRSGITRVKEDVSSDDELKPSQLVQDVEDCADTQQSLGYI